MSAVVGLAERSAEDAQEPVPSGLVIHTAEEGATVFDIAKRFRIPSARLIELNPSLSGGVRGGDKVLLLV